MREQTAEPTPRPRKYDVIAINIETHKVRIMDADLDEQNAEAVIKLAVMRRGVSEEFYVTAASGAFEDGEIWGELP